MGRDDAGLTRREFIGAAAGATLLSAASLGAGARVQGANDRVRIGLIGAGGRGRHLEVGFYATLPTVLGVMAVRQGRAIRWDDKELAATTV